ncbi:uncharacterized protein LOC117331612 [Pecten maximus]|uniref:uncharacterized protein LOC117331612 n=1 Tax=Pecten maximus TaxID=6579 RepID=UPI0014589062|nr:uncharacterized protein LOC117331612 [Pecten maximus]
MWRVQLRPSLFVLVVLPLYTVTQTEEDRYTRIFSEPCTNRFHLTFRNQKPFLIDLKPGKDGFHSSKLCRMAFTADPVKDEDGDNVLVCFKFLQFTFNNCTIDLGVEDIEQEIHFIKPLPPVTNKQNCFWRTTVYVTIRSTDYFNCDSSTSIRIEVRARNANPDDDRIMSTGNWITIALLIVVFSIGALSLGYYKYVYKVRSNRSLQLRTRVPGEDSHESRHIRYSPGRRSRPSLSVPQRSRDDQRVATNGSYRRANANRNQRATPYIQPGIGRGQDESRDHFRAPPPSYEECMAMSDTELYILGHSAVSDANVEDIILQEEVPTNGSPPPYPGF